jgi:predicted metal-dependent RNase
MRVMCENDQLLLRRVSTQTIGTLGRLIQKSREDFSFSTEKREFRDTERCVRAKLTMHYSDITAGFETDAVYE